MDLERYQLKVQEVKEQLLANEQLAKYVDASLPIPQPYVGTGPIKLIVIGQDPTVKNPRSRKSITTVLNLNKNGRLRRYLLEICYHVGISIEDNVYATNVYKNFFVSPPTQIHEINIFQAFKEDWFPLLLEELDALPELPIITLGEPFLKYLLKQEVPQKVRYYWGYTPKWQEGQLEDFRYVLPEFTYLERLLFPFPHQPSLRKPFYKTFLPDYTRFVRQTAFL